MTTYYEREVAEHLDGTPIFATAEDKKNETSIAEKFSSSFRCEMHPFGPLSPIDYYAARDGRLVGVVEIKKRPHKTNRYPTVFLNVRKWLALLLAEAGLGCPAIFVVGFDDDIRWIKASSVDATAVTIAGCKKVVKALSDVEPVIHVPVEAMKSIGTA